MKRFVVYGRKSRDAQNSDQIQHTFATQDWIMEHYLSSIGTEGVDYEVVATFAETLSGGGYYTKRPLFTRAVNMCKKDKSLILLCAKAERLARNVRSGTELMETINFVLANAPDADDLQKQLEFMIAEREWKNTSQRWKDMYQAKKFRCKRDGVRMQWGANADKYTANMDNPSRKNATEALNRTQVVGEQIKLIAASMSKPTYASIAEVLTKQGIPLPSKVIGTWKSNQIQRVCNRFNISIY